jgi:hypothetical protein
LISLLTEKIIFRTRERCSFGAIAGLSALLLLSVLFLVFSIFPRIWDMKSLWRSDGDFVSLREEIKETAKRKNQIEKLPSYSDRKATLLVLSDGYYSALLIAAKERALQVKSLEKVSSDNNEKGNASRVTISFAGQFKSLGSYLDYLETFPAPVVVDLLKVSTNDSVSDELTCELKLTILGY